MEKKYPITKKLLFNPKGNDFASKTAPVFMFDSPLTENPTGLFTIFQPMDTDIYDFVKLQKQRFWKADEYHIDRTKEQFDQLSDKDKKVFEYTLSFLSFLDSVQVGNIADMSVVYSMPEYRLWGAVHMYFEHEHSIAYSNILKGLFDTDDVKRIFYLAKDYPILRKRNELIANNFQQLFDIFWRGIQNVPLDEYARALAYVFAGTYAMESLTFYMGFKIIEFYQFKYGILNITNKMISEIKADELFHTKVMATIIKRIKPYITKYISENEFNDILRNTFKTYLNSDLEFYQSILQDNELGISQKQVEQYLKYLYDLRIRLLGLEPEFGMPENPFKEIDMLYGYVISHDNSMRKDSFFESKSAAYVQQEIDESVLDEIDWCELDDED